MVVLTEKRDRQSVKEKRKECESCYGSISFLSDLFVVFPRPTLLLLFHFGFTPCPGVGGNIRRPNGFDFHEERFPQKKNFDGIFSMG